MEALVSEKASGSTPTIYRSKEEQALRLNTVFLRWEEKGAWSLASKKVSIGADCLIHHTDLYCKIHENQMIHVNKGCLTRFRNDIRTDGSRIESFHRHLNNLQRSLPSGLRVFAGLAFDFILRRNVRITHSSNTINDPFVDSSYGSHHIFLVDCCNRLQNASLPTIPNIESNEQFGVVVAAIDWADFMKEEESEAALHSALPSFSLDADFQDATQAHLLLDIAGLKDQDFTSGITPAAHPDQLVPTLSSSGSRDKGKGRAIDPPSPFLKRTSMSPPPVVDARPSKAPKTVSAAHSQIFSDLI